MHELFLHHIIIIVHERSEHISASHSLQETSKARDHLEENIPPKGMWLWIHTGDMEPMNTYICRNIQSMQRKRAPQALKMYGYKADNHQRYVNLII